MSEKELPPCPYCGKQHFFPLDELSPLVKEYYVECIHCYAQGPHCDTPEQAIEAFINRTEVD